MKLRVYPPSISDVAPEFMSNTCYWFGPKLSVFDQQQHFLWPKMCLNSGLFFAPHRVSVRLQSFFDISLRGRRASDWSEKKFKLPTGGQDEIGTP